MATTGERIRRACTAPMPIELYDRNDSASMVRCTRPEGHDGDHSATVTIPRTVTWPEPDPRCTGTLGSRPDWMSPDQYDPCRCRLDAGHEGAHWCEHLGSPDPRLDADSASRREAP